MQRPPWHVNEPSPFVPLIDRLQRGLQLVFGAAILALILVVVCFAVFGGLEGRDDARHHRMRQDIQALRQTVLQLESELNNQTASLQPIGFSMHKPAPQLVPIFTVVTVAGWSTAGGNPAYDASGGAFNPATGIFTTAIAAKYQIDAAICWAAGSSGTRVGAIVNSASVAMNSFGTHFYGGIGATCNIMTVVYDLMPGDTVSVTVIHVSAGVQTISTATTLSIERIAVA